MTEKRPNVLLVLHDQLRYDVVAGSACATPAMDRLRREGAWFDRHYVPLGICSPSRAALLTGTYPHRNGVMNNMNGTEALADRLDPGYRTAGELLGGVGYRTGYVGKWHLGREAGPETRGFSDVAVPDHSLVDERFDPVWSKFAMSPGVGGGDTAQAPTGPSADAVLTRYPAAHPRHGERFHRISFPIYAGDPVDTEAIPGTAVAEESERLLERYAGDGEPFFLVASFIEPHWPNVLPEPFASMYDPADLEPWPNFHDTFEGKPRTNMAGLEHFGVGDFTWEDWAPIVAAYLGAVSYVDHLTGRLLDTLDALGLAEDTLVVMTTDHGDMTGSHRQFNKGPLMYEEVYHVPFIARGPGVAPGTMVEGLTSHVDVVPTLTALAGVDAPEEVQGASLVPLLAGTLADWRESLLCEFHGDEFGLYSQRMIRHGRYKLVYNPNDLRELYDLEADPAELRNLAYEPDYAEVRRELEVRLLELLHDTEDTLRLWAVNTLG